MSWLSDLIDSMTEAFTSLGTTILTFIKSGFTDLFLEVGLDNEIIGPSNLSIFLFFLMGVSLVIGLTTLVFRIVGNKGNF